MVDRPVNSYGPALSGSGHVEEEEEKTIIAPSYAVSGAVMNDEAWPDAHTAVVRRSAVGPGAPPSIPNVPVDPYMAMQSMHPSMPPLAAAPVGPQPMHPSMPLVQHGGAEATRILDASSLHEWIATSAEVSKLANGTADHDFRRSVAAEVSNPELFALPPDVHEAPVRQSNGRAQAIARAAGVFIGIIALAVGSLALLKPELLHQARATVFPQPPLEPAVLAVEITPDTGAGFNGPSVDEQWIGELGAAAARAMIAGKKDEALRLDRELHTLAPENGTYEGIARTLDRKGAE